MKLAFMGGCLNKQPGLSKNSSYYYLLRELLNNITGQPSITISLGQYTSYNLLSQETIKLITGKSPEILFLFLRPFPLMTLNKVWIKFNTDVNTSARKLHPSLFYRKNMNWDPAFTNYTLDDAVMGVRRKKFGLRDLNLLLGLSIGLNSWAAHYMVNQIETISNFCNSQNKKLVLISLPKNPESLLGNHICKLTNKKLKRNLQNIPFIKISSIGKEYFEPDGIHYNVEGHRLLAEMLYNYISKNISVINEIPEPILQKLQAKTFS